jgi:outer membrane protein OmpA-like peptidoglycan-associated protein
MVNPMMTNIRFSLLAAAMLLGSGGIRAQEDAEGTKDNPYLTRMPSFYISESGDKEFDAYTFYDGKKLVTVEGKLYRTTYWLKEGVAHAPSELQIRRNYITAVKNQGGTILFEGTYESFEDTRSGGTIVTAKIGKQGKELWVEVWPGNDNYTLTVLEKESMRQDVTASDMLEAINKEGYIALDIHFDTGKATIKPESQPIVNQIVALLKQNASLKLSIEGHTDNVGDAKSNKTLSENRAKTVMASLVASGISAERLSAAGFGAERPVADNRTEEGKAKNRRVELVKK